MKLNLLLLGLALLSIQILYGQSKRFYIKYDKNKVEQLECTERPKSGGSRSKVTLTFGNQSNKVLELYWLDRMGQERKYHTLGKGDIIPQQTYLTHPWKVKDAKTKACLGIIRATKQVYNSNIIFKTTAPRSKPKPRPQKTTPKEPILHVGITKYTNSRLGGYSIPKANEYELIRDNQHSKGTLLWFDQNYPEDLDVSFDFQIYDNDGVKGSLNRKSADGLSVLLFQPKATYDKTLTPVGGSRAHIKDGNGLSIHFKTFGKRAVIAIDGKGIILQQKFTSKVYTHLDWAKAKIQIKENRLYCYINNQLELDLDISNIDRKHHKGIGVGAATGNSDSRHAIRNITMQAIHNIANEEVKIGKTIQLDHIVFETAKSNLLAKSFEQLNQLVQLMGEHPNMEIEIHGHTDSKGAANYNQKLSENRTKSVYQYLINKGIKAGRMKYIGYGEDQPVANNETAEGRQLNRRVEFVIIKVEKDDKPLKTKIKATSVSKSISMSAWRMHEGNEGILNQVHSYHGDPIAYRIMTIPSQNDSGWKLATVDNNGKLNFGGSRASKLKTARKQVDFTYFETIINIPMGSKINEFKLSFTKADDGARVYVFNTKYPKGTFRGQIKLSGTPITEDYKNFLVAGEQNRIVIVQFDDAPVGNNLIGGQVLINGKPLNKYFTPSKPSTDKKAKTVSSTAKQQEKATTKDSFKDSRDGEVYKIVKIGNQVWMAENLRYNVKGSWLNPDNPSKEYGRLYTWDQARNACPKGWHVPTDAEWDKLISYSGGWESTGIKLKSTNGWAENSNGNNTDGFNALPSGIHRESEFTMLGKQTIFWGSVKGKSYYGWPRSLAYWDNRSLKIGVELGDYSCRCIKD